MKQISLLVLLVLSGCAGSLEQARGSTKTVATDGRPSRTLHRCHQLDHEHAVWSGVSKGAGVLGGLQGVAAVEATGHGITSVKQSKEASVGLALGALAFAALSVGAKEVSDKRAEAWARECAGDP